MKATRDAFGEQLVESGKDNPNIVGVNADLGKATKLSKFGEAYPDRFFEVGIAENNMIGVASGLSEYGYKVFLASFASFLTGKYDTIRCYSRNSWWISYWKRWCNSNGTRRFKFNEITTWYDRIKPFNI
jgi:transketolase C-terminal domain/subunit